MNARRLAIIIAPIAAAIVYACIQSCGAQVEPGGGGASGSDDARAEEASSGENGSADETVPDASVPSDAQTSEVATDSSATETSLLDSGEYCPSPLSPPRIDGCPCSPGSNAQQTCSPLTVGKVCDYRIQCPNHYGERFICQKGLTEPKGDVGSTVVYQWASKGIIPCDPDAADYVQPPDAQGETRP